MYINSMKCAPQFLVCFSKIVLLTLILKIFTVAIGRIYASKYVYSYLSYIYFILQVLSVIDTVLFSLLILKSLKNKNGDVWRLISSQLYMIEVTYCDNDLVNNLRMQQKSTLSLLQLLPSIKCVGPEDSLKPNQGMCLAITLWDHVL